jgi:hypothetical protein
VFEADGGDALLHGFGERLLRGLDGHEELGEDEGEGRSLVVVTRGSSSPDIGMELEEGEVLADPAHRAAGDAGELFAGLAGAPEAS